MDRAEQVRRAVVSGEFSKAARLWSAYAAELREDLERGEASEARMAEARELVEWSRRMALAARARAQNRLSEIQVALKYREPDPPPVRVVRTKA